MSDIISKKMQGNLGYETKKSIFWNGLDKVGFQVVALFVGLITARLLSPKDFGLIGALTIFTALSNIFVESGFTSAMVRRKNNTDAEYMAVLIFNILISVFAYSILFFAAPFIASFFEQPELKFLSRLLFLSIVLSSFCIVQTIILTQKLEFKTLSKANLFSAIFAGLITILLIYLKYTYLALAWQIILQNGFKAIFLWIMSDWKPTKKVNFNVISELFSFSFSLIISSTMITSIRYVYNIVIGRYFPMNILGYYSQAFKFHQIPSNVVSATISGVAYPVLSKLNDEENRQLLYFRKLIRVTAFCIFPIMLGLVASFDNLVEIILTSKWLPIVPYFRILCVAAIFMPLHSMNTSIITLKGFPKRSLSIEIIRNTIIVISLFFCLHNIELMLVFFSFSYFISYIISTFYISKIINYKILKQLKDILPYALVSIVMALLVYSIPNILDIESKYLLSIIQIFFGFIFYLFVSKICRFSIVEDLVTMVKKNKFFS